MKKRLLLLLITMVVIGIVPASAQMMGTSQRTGPEPGERVLSTEGKNGFMEISLLFYPEYNVSTSRSDSVKGERRIALYWGFNEITNPNNHDVLNKKGILSIVGEGVISSHNVTMSNADFGKILFLLIQ